MKRLLFPLFLACLLMPSPSIAHDHGNGGMEYDTYSACVECDCPIDCDCRKPGGTCPENGPCACDCPCKADKYAAGPDFFIHRDVRSAIEKNESVKRGHEPVSRKAELDYMVFDGQKHFTGYKPTWDTYRNAKFLRLRPWEGHTAGLDLPKRFNALDCGVSPVRGQLCGDCWAQSTISTHEANLSCATQSSKIFSVQDIIDNSGFGTCGGGDLAGEFLKKMGAVLEVNYKYLGRNNGKHTNLVREPEKPSEVYFLRGADGGWPTMEEVKRAQVEFGPSLAICGSASSLGRGGRVPNPGRGATNHCYSLYGWDETDFFDVKNSWGDCDKSNPLSNDRCWGDKGHGYYPWGKGSWVTEIQIIFNGKPMPKEPIVFELRSKFAKWNITIAPPFDGWNQASLTKEFVDALANVEVAQ